MTQTLNKKESERFLRKMLETEQRPITKKERELAAEIRRNFPEVGHRIVEKTDWIMPIFFIFLSWSFLMIMSYFASVSIYMETKNLALTMFVVTMFWIIWAWSILKNKTWKPERVINIEHYIINGEVENEKPRKKSFSLFKLWKRK